MKKAKKDTTTTKILAIIPIKTVEELEGRKPIVSELDIQLGWYRQVPGSVAWHGWLLRLPSN